MRSIWSILSAYLAILCVRKHNFFDGMCVERKEQKKCEENCVIEIEIWDKKYEQTWCALYTKHNSLSLNKYC